MEPLNIADPGFKADPWGTLERLRSAAPIVEVKVGKRRGWLVTRYADATAALKHPQLVKDKQNAFGRPVMPKWMPRSARALSRNMLDLDEPDHRRLRALVQPAFNPRLVERLRERVATLCDELIDKISRGATIDLIADYAAPIPTTIIAEMLGVPPADHNRFRRWTEKIVVADTSDWAMLRALPSIVGFIRYLRRLIAQKRRTPGDDVISSLLAAEAEGDRLSPDEVLAMAFLLLVAGHETTVNLIGNGVLTLIENPAALEALRADSALAASAVEEILRYSGPLMISTERYAKEDLELGGTAIPRGALVLVSLASANRDAAVFSEADMFDIRRNPNRHLAFGDGQHFCLGSALARMEGQIAIAAFIGRFCDIRLGVDPQALKWKRGATLRGVEALPLFIG